MTLDPQRSPWRRRAQLLCALGIGLASVCAGWRVPVVEFPVGSDWGHHFTVAEFFWHPSPDIAYPLFRRPFFGWLMGAMGEGVGYFAAAQLIGRLSAVVIALAAGLGAWALVGPLAGLVAAWIVVGLPLVIEGAVWVNHYPLLGAASGLGLAAGAAVSRWPRVPMAVLAGLASASAAVMDVRGEVVLVAAVMLLLLGLSSVDRKRFVGLLFGFGIAAGGVLLHSQWLHETFSVPQLHFEEQVRVQRSGVLGQVHQGIFADPVLEGACEDVVAGPMSLIDLTTPCTAALRVNAWRRLSGGGGLPDRWTLMLLPLVLLPIGAGRGQKLRSVLASGIVFGVPLGSLFIGMGWVTYFPRYVLPFGAVLAMLIPVALGRSIPLLGKRQRWTGVMAAVLSAVWAFSQWPGPGAGDSAAKWTAPSGADRAAGVLAKWTLAELDDSAAMMDCAGLAIDSLLLPTRLNYQRFPPGDPDCERWIRQPIHGSGRLYLVTMHRDLPENTVSVAFDSAAIAALGWIPQKVAGMPEGFIVWRTQ